MGSTIQTAYVLLIMIAILILLFKNRYILLSIHLLGTLAILLSFSRGPILSWVIVYLLFFLINSLANFRLFFQCVAPIVFRSIYFGQYYGVTMAFWSIWIYETVFFVFDVVLNLFFKNRFFDDFCSTVRFFNCGICGPPIGSLFITKRHGKTAG